MALPVSPNTITANNINVELGRAGTAAFSINGADERALAGVASGQISFSDFHGKSNTPDINLANRTITGYSGAGFRLRSNGVFEEIGVNSSNNPVYTAVATWWMDPAGAVPGSNYDMLYYVYESNTSFDVTDGNQYTKLNMNVDREFYFDSSVGGRYIDVVLEIYEAGTANMVADGFFLLQDTR